jgi:prepilin-type N-terminal cleavage/methylation domain-containing protein
MWQMFQCRQNDEQGFTLIEVLAATTLLLIVFTCLFGIYVQSTAYNTSNREKLQAVYLAKKAVSTLRSDQATVPKNAKEGDEVNISAYNLNQSHFEVKATVMKRTAEADQAQLLPVQISVIETNSQKILAKTFVYLKEASS